MKLKRKLYRMVLGYANAYRADGYTHAVDTPKPLWARASSVQKKRAEMYDDARKDVIKRFRKVAGG